MSLSTRTQFGQTVNSRKRIVGQTLKVIDVLAEIRLNVIIIVILAEEFNYPRTSHAQVLIIYVNTA